MAIYLIRHGESEGNRQQVFQGSLPFELTELGVNQAQACGAWLAGLAIKPAQVFTSPMVRAQQTAKIISQLLGGPEPEVANELREIGAGALEGLSEEAARRQHSDYGRTSQLMPADSNSWGGESAPQLSTRVLLFRDFIQTQYAAQDVLAVSHGGVLCALINHWCGWPAPQQLHLKLSNCCCAKLELRDLAGHTLAQLQWLVPLDVSAPQLTQ
ncbi:histidine phosphatase family protein [bacterium]|nr:histidine phosphatase family protein [bacterium]